MSLTKKDPSLRVAANDPHLVSLGGGRLSTAVTIHYIPIGDMTIGSSTNCSISLNGTGVRPTHCTIYRSEENEVTIVPEQDARILIDGTKIGQETNLTQGAMITIGNSNYLRFNNPAEAQLMRSAMGSNERISMPQIDFTQVPQRHSAKSVSSGNDSSAEVRQSLMIDSFYETSINPLSNSTLSMSMTKETTVKSSVPYNKEYNNVAPIDINGLQCPKVFTADLVTVNMPAKDVLGQKYANFAKNLAENHRGEKQVSNALRNNQVGSNNNLKSSNITGSPNTSGNYVNIPSTSNFIQNTTNAQTNSPGSTEYLTKVQNTTPLRAVGTGNHHHNAAAYDRYPKPGTYGGLQIYPMNGVNTEINNGLANASPLHKSMHEPPGSPASVIRGMYIDQKRNLSSLSNTENERLEDMLKICTEYADRQNQSCSSITSSPIVQNRIKTNGSLPRDKKSPFHHEVSNGSLQLQQSFSGSNSNLTTKSRNGSIPASSGYENVRLVGQNRVEISGQIMGGNAHSITLSPKTGYENVVIGKYVPQSPRTKIRTTCMSPKKEHSFGPFQHLASPPLPVNSKPSKQTEYEQLIKTFEEKWKLEMQAIEASSRYVPPTSASAEQTPAKRTNKNINNLSLNLKEPSSLQNSPKLSKKPAPAPRILSKTHSGSASSLRIGSCSIQTQRFIRSLEEGDADVDQLKRTRKCLLGHIQTLKNNISELQRQEDEVLRELDMEKALVSAEVTSLGDSVRELENELLALQNKIHRLEAQRNATRVMEENQQAKLKQSIEMKQDQLKKLKTMLKQKPNNDCLKEELSNVGESLENDRKTFEDLEFQYLEEESEWHAYREDLHAEEKCLTLKIEEKRLELQHLEKQELASQTTDAKALKNNLIARLNELKATQEQLRTIENSICDVTGQLHLNSSDEEEDITEKRSASPTNLVTGVMSQSLFGSAELLCPKRTAEDVMSKSVNENMFYNNKIELPSAQATSTPKRPQLKIVDMDDVDMDITSPKSACSELSDSLLRAKCNEADEETNERVKFNLSLGSDDFEVNPLERRVPSQDDIDRICKLTLDTPISTKGASTKIFDSIKEIERNRQLLLAQQGHHVIEHERQKMHDLKKKCHDEARAQYLSMLSSSLDTRGSTLNSNQQTREMQKLEGAAENAMLMQNKENQQQQRNSTSGSAKSTGPDTQPSSLTATENTSPQRHSQPEFDQQRLSHSRSSPRPLSEANSELSCDLLSESNVACKSSIELSATAAASAKRLSAEQSASGDDAATKRSSVNSNETTSGGSGHSERKRTLPKHQRPLTRYLPIFSPDLNLRHHIESAGHQIAQCPHVFVDAFSCRGYLHKLGATFHGWARRWFVLDRQRNAFIYYADKSERKPRGGAYFSTIDEVYLDHLNASKSGRPHCTFIVKTKKRSYHLQAASDAAARIWIDAIITGAQGNLDY